MEAYNAFNHTQFDANGNQTNAPFGEITSARPPRVIQLSANFRF